jgi:hypothetical protein
MVLKVKTFRWNKEEQKALDIPKRTYAVMKGNSIVKGRFTSKKDATKKLVELKKYY